MSLITHIVNMILNHLLTYNFLMASAAAHVCMWRETSSQKVANQADKPANKRQVLRALVALSLYSATKYNKLTLQQLNLFKL